MKTQTNTTVVNSAVSAILNPAPKTENGVRLGSIKGALYSIMQDGKARSAESIYSEARAVLPENVSDVSIAKQVRLQFISGALAKEKGLRVENKSGMFRLIMPKVAETPKA